MRNEVIDGFATRLREAMQDKGWNQKVLSERSGIHHQQIHKLLRGERTNPQVSTVLDLARALEVSVDYLLGRTKSKVVAVEQ